MQDNTENLSIYGGVPLQTPEQEAAREARQREWRSRLPKFRLAEGEEFDIPREKLLELTGTYLDQLNNFQSGFMHASEEMRSFMESLFFEAFKSEVYALQRDGAIEGTHKREIYQQTKQLLNPGWIKRWRFSRKVKPNYAMKLCMREAQLEVENKLSEYREDIAKQEKILYGEPEAEQMPVKVEDVFNEIVDSLISPRKRDKFVQRNGAYLMGILAALVQRPVTQKEEAKPERELEDKQELSDSIKESAVPGEVPEEEIAEADLTELYDLEELDESDVEELEEEESEAQDESEGEEHDNEDEDESPDEGGEDQEG